VPTGASLSAGTNNGNGSWTLTQAQLTNLTITPAANSDADFTLGINAIATEGTGGDTETTTASIPVTVIPAASVLNSLTNRDDAFQGVDLSFAFPFQGATYDKLYVSTNGNASLGTNASVTWNASVNTFRGETAPIIAPFWSDLDLRSMGKVFFNDLGDSAVISWDGVGAYTNRTKPFTFEMELVNDGSIMFSYQGISDISYLWRDLIIGTSPAGGVADPGENDFSADTPFNSATSGIVYEYFSRNSETFDLDNTSIVFDPISGGGFSVSEVTHQGTSANDSLVGSVDADGMVGGLGNDTVIGNGGADVLLGGGGDDILAISDVTFHRINGGSGTDTLRLDGTLNLDLTTIANSKTAGIEAIDITGSGNNTLTLDLQDILDLSNTSNTLQIDGDAGDTVVVSSGSFTSEADQVINSVNYNVYSGSGANLLVNEDVGIQWG